jgi:phosphoenolpyruvate carboxylase
MDEILYKSNKEKKRLSRTLDQEQFLEEKKTEPFLKAWEEAQVKAATIQSALDYAVEQYSQHKDELEEKVQKEIEEQISLRQEEIKDFLMTEKERYLASIGILED